MKIKLFNKKYEISIGKSNVVNPGSRGGKYWIDNNGKVHYGERPTYEELVKMMPNAAKQITTTDKNKKYNKLLTKYLSGQQHSNQASAEKERNVKINEYKTNKDYNGLIKIGEKRFAVEKILQENGFEKAGSHSTVGGYKYGVFSSYWENKKTGMKIRFSDHPAQTQMSLSFKGKWLNPNNIESVSDVLKFINKK